MGISVGISMGSSMGISVGTSVGISVGTSVEISVGTSVGISVGISVGVSVGESVRGISALFVFENVIHKREVAREEPLRRPAYMVEKPFVFILNFLMLNGQALKRRQTLRIVGLCYACFGAFELFLHARIPTFTATFGKNRVEMLLHRFALFFHCVIEVFVVLVCQLGVVFYISDSFRVFFTIFVEIQSVIHACFYPIDHMN